MQNTTKIFLAAATLVWSISTFATPPIVYTVRFVSHVNSDYKWHYDTVTTTACWPGQMQGVLTSNGKSALIYIDCSPYTKPGYFIFKSKKAGSFKIGVTPSEGCYLKQNHTPYKITVTDRFIYPNENYEITLSQ